MNPSTSGASNYDTGDSGEAVRQLNSFLRGEISAEETYRMAIEKVADSEKAAATEAAAPRTSAPMRPARIVAPV